MHVTDFTSGVGDAGNWILWVSAIAALTVTCVLFTLKAIYHTALVQFEWNDPVRAYFFYAPHIACLMLGQAAPEAARRDRALRVLWAVMFALQLGLTTTIYARWLFSARGHLGNARAPYLLSTIGWFLLCNLGQEIDLREEWQLNLPAFVFGCGCFFFCILVASIFLRLHEFPQEKGHPSLFLLIAPPSTGALSLALFQGAFGVASQAILGFVLMLILVLLRLSPKFFKRPSSVGVYWAYVFPLSAAASATVRYGDAERTTPAYVLGWTVISIALCMLLAVLLRFLFHLALVLRGLDEWSDPLAEAFLKKRQSIEAEFTRPRHGACYA